ncbi:hypothetical protein AEM51_13320 [Bacteroidetes bacterium UKL13-3]|jgi:ankyrin repeat protein|nr:hypothetical protein AEM51_13320 [Bacteroidetes bacterium UKL13-3]HCP93089.1 hypothetical protein [Bacteroidota bacterium]
MIHKSSCLLIYLFSVLIACGQNHHVKNIEHFNHTRAYELAKAVQQGNKKKVERLVKSDSSLLNVINPSTGANVLVLAIDEEQYEVFKLLLELGADPNFINPYSKHSALMMSIRPFGNDREWRKEYRYAELLLKYQANPNYIIEKEFTNEKGISIKVSSALLKASGLDLFLVKLLIEYGADCKKKLGKNQITPFGEALEASKFDIINYYIDTLKINVHEPLYIRTTDSLFIQDFVVNNKTLAKLKNDSFDIGEYNRDRWLLIKKLESMGVDFKNYTYKR